MGYPFSLEGTCQNESDPCPGGTAEGLGSDPAGSCTGGGDICCIADDQCEALGMGYLSCSEEETGTCFQLGCPDYGYCCASMGG